MIMQNKINKLLCIILLLSASSCRKYLDITPDGRMSMDEVWSSNTTAAAYLNYAYEPMLLSQGGTQYYWHAFLESCTDLFHDSHASDPLALISNGWYQGTLSPTYDPTTIGDNKPTLDVFWSGIRRCNVFLMNVDKAVFNDPREKIRLKAEAIVLRAYYYMELSRKYGPMPILKEPLPIDVNFSTLKRPVMQDVATFVNESWLAVKDVPEFPWRLLNATEKGRMTKAVMLLIRARVQALSASPLWNPNHEADKWALAKNYASEGLQLLSSNGYELYHDATLGEKSFEEYFLTPSDLGAAPRDKETILENSNLNAFYGSGFPSYINGFPQRPDAIKAGSCPTQELVDAFDMKATGLPAIDPLNRYQDAGHLNPNYVNQSGYDPLNPYVGRDPRFYATVLYNGAYSPGTGITLQTYVGGASEIRKRDVSYSPTGYYLRKYINQNSPPHQSPGTPWKRMRFAEFYLLLAEAENELNGPDQNVYLALKPVRDRAHMPNIESAIASKEEARAYIQKEWTTEFALEEQRFWNVRRWKILDQTDKVVTGMQITKTGTNSFTYQRVPVFERKSWEARFLIFPIPNIEIAIYGAAWQNPGW